MIRMTILATLATAAFVAAGGAARAADPAMAKYIVGDKRSGYVFAAPETREMMDEDINNPSFLWVQKGEQLWSKPDGAENKSCASCHQAAKATLKTAGASYPKYDEALKKMVNIEQRINICREKNMKAAPFKWESDEMLGMTAYVKLQARGMPVNVKIDGPAAPYFEKGKAFYFERRGQMDLACANCHVDNAGKMIRAELLTQGQSNGFPTYRLKWQKLGSLHRRFSGCNDEIRAVPYPMGSDEYTALELYVAWRGQGLPVESPSVRK